MTESQDWLTVGKIVAAQGLKGELRVNPSSDFPERFTEPGLRWIKKGKETIKKIQLISGRHIPGKSLFVIKLEGINNRNAAESLIGNELLVPSSSRPELPENEFHLLDLIGLQVRLEPLEYPVGEVIGLESAGNDLLEIQLKEGKKVLVPFVEEIVPKVKINEGWLEITPPPGLLDL